MNLSHEEEENSLSLSKFESMLKTNKVFFFDSEEFELLFAFTWIGDSTRKLAEIEYDVDVALSLQHITSD